MIASDLPDLQIAPTADDMFAHRPFSISRLTLLCDVTLKELLRNCCEATFLGAQLLALSAIFFRLRINSLFDQIAPLVCLFARFGERRVGYSPRERRVGFELPGYRATKKKLFRPVSYTRIPSPRITVSMSS
jgi:hypothetical protein